MKNMTFIEFLTEMDRGDHQLQQDAIQRQRQIEKRDAAGAALAKGNNDFKNKMNDSRGPEKGDIVTIGKNKFSVIHVSIKGFNLKQLGGNQEGILKHGTKFELSGKTDNGRNQFKFVKQQATAPKQQATPNPQQNQQRRVN